MVQGSKHCGHFEGAHFKSLERVCTEDVKVYWSEAHIPSLAWSQNSYDCLYMLNKWRKGNNISWSWDLEASEDLFSKLRDDESLGTSYCVHPKTHISNQSVYPAWTDCPLSYSTFFCGSVGFFRSLMLLPYQLPY